ncbi:MAG: pectin methylesterase [Clostridia bacterium]|nr:pectin methylesterase [Clostridia bacterium]
MPEPFILHAGIGTDVPTLEKALALLPADESIPACIHLAPGVYREKVSIIRANTTVCGESAEDTVLVYGDGAFETLPDGSKRGTFRTATLRTDADGVTLKNLTIRNDASPRERVGQALALYADGDMFTCEDCILDSFQDTLFTAPLPPKEVQKNGFIGPKQYAPRKQQRHTYLRCTIRGDIDFIFGGAAAWFEACDIVSVDGRENRSTPCEGYATAASTPEGQKFGYVFNRCRFLSDVMPAGSVYLGRPWREFAKTVFLYCELGAHIHPDGYTDWNKPHENLFYAEYGCIGPGAMGMRAPFARQLTPEACREITYEAFMRSL